MTDESAFDANKAGKKGMSYYSWTTGAIDHRDFREILELAFDRDLVVTLRRDEPWGPWTGDHQALDIFVSRPEELWRVPAWLALKETAFVDGRWSEAAENLQSYLLGYTKTQREHWIEARRETDPAYTCATIYALLDRSAVAAVESVGRRCFGPNDSIDGLPVFFHRGNVLRRDARSRVPRGYTLARAGLQWAAFHELFGKWDEMKKRGLIERTIDARAARTLNANLLSNVQLLTRSGWK